MDNMTVVKNGFVFRQCFEDLQINEYLINQYMCCLLLILFPAFGL